MRLEARDLAFGYPRKPVGRGVSFAVGPGEVLVLLGPNGSGKTTLFKTLLGLLKPQGGAVTIDGRPVGTLSPRRLARVMGYVPQAYAGYFPFTVLDTVLMGRTARIGLFATPSAADRRIAERVLDLLGIYPLRDEPYTRISGGERQLTLIARALVQEPGLLLMDEPTANLDFGHRLRVLDHIRGLAAQGIGIVLSTHEPDHAFLCGDLVAILHEGRLVRLGRPEDVITAETLAAVYGVEVEVWVLEDGPAAKGGPRRVCVPVPGARDSRGDRSRSGGPCGRIVEAGTEAYR